MIGEKERKNREELFKLMREHPELPVVPMVDSEIVTDECAYFIGAWGYATIDEYFISERAERVFFKSDKDVFGVLEKHMSAEEFYALPESEEECMPYYDALPWKKAIIIYINSPE